KERMIRLPRPLWVGSVIACIAAGIFVAIAVNVLTDGFLARLDRTIALEMKEAGEQPGALRPIMIGVTNSGGVAAMTIMAVLGVVWESWRGHGKWRVAVGWAVIALGGSALNLGLKVSLQRERPPKEWRDRAIFETNESFPSGHAMGGTIGIGLLGYTL